MLNYKRGWDKKIFILGFLYYKFLKSIDWTKKANKTGL
ncbi:hypothetical protein SORDD14_01456 [Streptococcus oralis]|uniref:Uncharacterized protein n=1 Tax=Streptococcus oralis TaxID=1303 RepID=A0A139NXC6_STROR|nr:hypothetical protein SORDD14_01456 [Streptococcus oralis]